MDRSLSSKGFQAVPYALSRISNEAIVSSVVRQGHEWRVGYEGTFWTARLLKSGISLLPGDVVYVVHREGLVLFVELPPIQQSAN